MYAAQIVYIYREIIRIFSEAAIRKCEYVHVQINETFRLSRRFRSSGFLDGISVRVRAKIGAARGTECFANTLRYLLAVILMRLEYASVIFS